MNPKDMEKIKFASSLLDLVDAAAYFIDTEGRYIHINKAAEKKTGCSDSVICGRTVLEVSGLQDTPLLRSLRDETPINDLLWQYYVDGGIVTHLCNISPLYMNGELVGAYSVERDLTKINEMINDNINLQKGYFRKDDDSVSMDMGMDPNERNNIDSVFDCLVGMDDSFLEALQQASLASKNDSPVMLTGSTGSGKELFAKCIHSASARSRHPFVAINCASIPEQLLEGILFGTAKGAYTDAKDKPGIFEQVENGTLFLDEINSMPKYSQSKLLRVLEEKKVRRLGGDKEIPVNARIISSSNNLSNFNDGLQPLREDLFYRLAVVNIVIPDLVQRKSDILLLTRYFIQQFNEMFHKNIIGIDPEVHRIFMEYTWPGNVRQLRNCLESAMNFVDDVDVFIKKQHLPQYLLSKSPRSIVNEPAVTKINQAKEYFKQPKESTKCSESVYQTIEQREKERITEALLATNGNITQAAKILHIGRQALSYRIRKYQIK